MIRKKQKVQKSDMVQRIIIVYAAVASTVAIVLLALFFQQYLSQQRIFAESDFKLLVKDAALQHTAEPVIHPVERQIYFPSMRIRVPLTDIGEKLLYEYDPYTEAPVDDFLRVGSILSKTVIYDFGKSLDQMPCQRLVRVTFNQKEPINDDFKVEAEVRLQDGRTMYLYPNRDEKCAEVWLGLTPDRTTELFKQAQSY